MSTPGDRRRLEEIKRQSQSASTEQARKIAIQDQVSRVRKIQDDLASSKKLKDPAQIQAAQQSLETRMKEELLRKNDLVAKDSQRSENIKKTKNNDTLFQKLVVATVLDIERRQEEAKAALLDEKKHHPDHKKSHHERKEEEKEDEKEEDQIESPGQRLNKFFALMEKGMDLAPKLQVNQLLENGRLELEHKKLSLNGKEYDAHIQKEMKGTAPRLEFKGGGSGKKEDEKKASPTPFKKRPEPSGNF